MRDLQMLKRGLVVDISCAIGTCALDLAARPRLDVFGEGYFDVKELD